MVYKFRESDGRSSLFAVAFVVSSYLVGDQAYAGVWQHQEDFESTDSSQTGWFAGPNAGFDFGKELAHTGRGNAWVRNRDGWTAVNRWLNPPAGTECRANAWIRMSSGVTAGYFSVRSGDGWNVGPVVSEVKLTGPSEVNPDNANYNKFLIEFRSTGGPMLFYVGNWGNGNDNWLQVDDFIVQCFD